MSGATTWEWARPRGMRSLGRATELSDRRDALLPSAGDSIYDRYIRSGTGHRRHHIPTVRGDCSTSCERIRIVPNIYRRRGHTLRGRNGHRRRRTAQRCERSQGRIVTLRNLRTWRWRPEEKTWNDFSCALRTTHVCGVKRPAPEFVPSRNLALSAADEESPCKMTVGNELGHAI